MIYICCKELQINWKEAKYCLLGDDIIIGDKALAEKYTSMIRSLGVEISEMKSHISPHTFEFAKRWIHKGKEISPFPLSAIQESSSKYFYLVNILNHARSREYPIIPGVPRVVEQFHSSVLNHPSRMRKKIREKSCLTALVLQILRDPDTAKIIIPDILRYVGFDSEIQQQLGFDPIGLISSIAVECFADSQEGINEGKPLGLLAEITLIHIITYENIPPIDYEVWVDLGKQCVPWLQAHGHIEELYLEIQRKAKYIDTIGGGEWPLFLRALTIPVSDSIYTERVDEVVTRASATLADKLLKRCEQISTLYQLHIFKDYNSRKVNLADLEITLASVTSNLDGEEPQM